mmetsp:Transcript_10785/g.12489  ORF Transcript_10785/g.12489 Transcript_10785/m.12489 type:complete len:1540 (-) Transcript_10785:2-4621(-)
MSNPNYSSSFENLNNHENRHYQQQQQQQKQHQNQQIQLRIPHHGSLCRIHMNIDNRNTSTSYNQPSTYIYAIRIQSLGLGTTEGGHDSSQYQLKFHPSQYKFMNDLFLILDTNSRGYITKQELQDFVFLRCPVFKRRDETLKEFHQTSLEDNNDDSNDVEEDDYRNQSHQENVNVIEEQQGIVDKKMTSVKNAVAATTIEETVFYNNHIDTQSEEDIFCSILGDTYKAASSSSSQSSYGQNNNFSYDDVYNDDHEKQEQEVNSNFMHQEIGKEDKKYENENATCFTSTPTIPLSSIQSQTFEEVWNAVIECCLGEPTLPSPSTSYIGIEAWMVFCRFISLAQYQDAKRRFSARHVQQTMPQKNSSSHSGSSNNSGMGGSNCSSNCSTGSYNGGGHSLVKSSSSNEVILIDVPPLEPPVEINVQNLILYEQMMMIQNSQSHTATTTTTSDGKHSINDENIGIALPELDLDHSHLSLHDNGKQNTMSKVSSTNKQSVQISLFSHGVSSSTSNNIIGGTGSSCGVGITSSSTTASSLSSSSQSENLEFVIRYSADGHNHEINNDSGSSNRNTSSSSSNDNIIAVRRSFADMSWLHDTFTSQKQLGGTLCGRILPPFPSTNVGSFSKSSSKKTSSDYYDDEKNTTSSTAISVASASAVMVSSAAKSAKSFLGRLSLSTSSSPTMPSTSLKVSSTLSSSKSGKTSRSKGGQPVSSTSSASASTASDRNALLTTRKYSNSARRRYTMAMDSFMDTSECKSKQLEKYINYMLDHPAMSTSFPLNVILKASQSGVESAKRILMVQNKKSNQGSADVDQSSIMDTRKYLEKYSFTGNHNLSWVRTAAQAALALKLHGILETTGYQSVSTKLQHASLPKFSKSNTFSDGVDEGMNLRPVSSSLNGTDSEDDFEKGIVCIESSLDQETRVVNDGGGYDLLPSPLPIAERSALCAGSILPKSSQETPIHHSDRDLSSRDSTKTKSRVRYGHIGSNDDSNVAILGDVSVDRDIDRLREIIRRVDASLSRCLSAGLVIGTEAYGKTGICLDILKGVDSWEGMRGKIIGQRALLSGVAALEKTRDISHDSTKSFVIDMSWHASLASSAVAAADEVREAVKASKTAARAKIVAETAAMNADQYCNTTSFSTIDEARNAQMRASKLRSQAIHATVVEYEAFTAKRQAAVALARDVKCWNIHRKREILKTCLDVAMSQRKAAANSMTAWEELREGLLNSSSISSVVHSSVEPLNIKRQGNDVSVELEPDPDPLNGDLKLGASSCSLVHYNIDPETEDLNAELERAASESSLFHSRIQSDPETLNPESAEASLYSLESLVALERKLKRSDSDNNEDIHSEVNSRRDSDSEHHENVIGFNPKETSCVDDKHVIESDIEQEQSLDASDLNITISDYGDNVKEESDLDLTCGGDDENLGGSYVVKVDETSTTEGHLISEPDAMSRNAIEADFYIPSSSHYKRTNENGTADFRLSSETGIAASTDEQVAEETYDHGMTDSMQSLVDGLMTWGGQFDEEEDLLPLPYGIAASMLEERGVLNLQ